MDDLPQLTNLYDLLGTAGRYLVGGELKRVSIFFHEGRRIEIEVMDAQSRRIRYQRIESSQNRFTNYSEITSISDILLTMYDDTKSFLNTMMRGNSNMLSQVFIRFYGAKVDKPIIYTYEPQRKLFIKTS